MDINVIALAIPVFFALIGVEVWVAKRQGRSLFRFPIAIADLSCGIGNQVSAILFGGLLFAGYVWLFDTVAPIKLSADDAWVWAVGFLLTDVVYYFWHRVSHRCNAIWAAHVVHHHSQDYNLAVALRQAWFTQFSNMFFFFSLALLGFPPVVFAVSLSVNTLYQFWIHTQTIDRLGPLEWVFNTPSHHRVHHGINPHYIDKNYAGIFIVWDRLFGTFAPEQETVVYGTVTPFESTNSAWANFVLWRELSMKAKALPRWRHKLAVFLGPPEWTPEGLKPTPPVDAERFVKFSPQMAPGTIFYLVTQFVVVTVALVGLLLFQKQIPVVGHVVGGAMIVWTTVNFSGVTEQRHWARASEWARLVLVPVSVGLVLHLSHLPVAWTVGTIAGVAVMAATSGLLFRRCQITPPAVVDDGVR